MNNMEGLQYLTKLPPSNSENKEQKLLFNKLKTNFEIDFVWNQKLSRGFKELLMTYILLLLFSFKNQAVKLFSFLWKILLI